MPIARPPSRASACSGLGTPAGLPHPPYLASRSGHNPHVVREPPLSMGAMSRTLLIPLALTGAVLAAGCSSTTTPATTPPASQPPPSVAVPSSQPADLALGQAGQVIGDKGTKLTLTPLAVRWTKGAKDLDPPANGWFLVIALRAEATTGIDTIAPPVSGYGLYWRGQETTLDSSEGNASVTAWAGTVNEFGAPIEPGQPETAIKTYDVPAKGGRLIYVNADGTITGWQLPPEDAGDQKLFKRVDARIKEFGGERPA